MARTNTLSNFLTDVATAIKNKKGSQQSILASNFDTEIANLPSGGGKYTPNYISFAYYDGQDLSDELSNLDVSNITNMNYMFYASNSLEELDLSSFNTSNVTSMESMFSESQVLSSLDVSSFNTSNVTNMYTMFSYMYGMQTLDISNFDFSSIVSVASMFEGCSVLETITFPSDMSLDNVYYMENMFNETVNLDENTLNEILKICTTVGSNFTDSKTLEFLGITSGFTNYESIPTLSNYQDFLNAGWTID